MMGMSAARAEAAGSDLVALAHALKSGTLEQDLKAYLAAAKKATDAESKLSETAGAIKAREAAAEKKEKSNSRASAKIKSDREALKIEQDQWTERKAKEQEDLIQDRTRLTVDASAVAARDQKAQAMMSEARTLTEAAKTLDEQARNTKADYQARIAKLETLARGA